jgi:peptidyl-prolyl cis-trans isomerase D
MFDFVQEKKRLVQIVLALIILPFAFWGVDSYNKAGNGAEIAATVNGTKITQREYDNALLQQQDRLRKLMGANFDPAILDNPEIKHSVMDNLVEEHLLTERGQAIGLTAIDAQVAQVIEGVEAFQDNGKFDKKLYTAVLAKQNMSPLGFEARLRTDLIGQQVRDAYTQNGYASNSVAENIIRLNEQIRIVSTSKLSFQSFMSQAKVDDAELKKYYDQNQPEFQVQEQVKVEYVQLSVSNLLSKVELKPEDPRKYYDEHQSEFGQSEERHAAHILISVAAKATQAEQDAAKARAEHLLQQVKANPASFAELAKQNSQDPGSAANGGSLGFFGKGMMVKPFEDVAFMLKPGEVSDLVKSDFGYHIIKLLEIKPGRILPFAEASAGIINKLRQQKASDMFAELAEKFSNTVYEQSDTLKPAADLAGSKIEQSGWLVKGAAAAEPWTAKMLQAIFTDEVLKNKRNTAAIEVASNTLVAARTLEYKPAAVRALAEVQDAIRQKLLRAQAVELATKQGKSLLEQLQRGEKIDLSWTAAQEITRAKAGSLDKEVVRKVFQTPADKLPQYVGAETQPDGFILVRIDAVKESAKPDDAKRAAYAKQLRRLMGEELLRAYLADAKHQASIKVTLSKAAPVQP